MPNREDFVNINATLTREQFEVFRAMLPGQSVADAVRHCIANFAFDHRPDMTWPHHEFLQGVGGNRGGGRKRKQPQNLGG